MHTLHTPARAVLACTQVELYHVIDRWQSLRPPRAPPPSRGADRTPMDVNAEQYGKFMAPAAPLHAPLRAEEVEEALAQHAAAIEEALGVRCIDPRASPELYMWAPDLEGALAGEEAAARVAERRVVEWECRAGHRFGASVQCLMAQVQRRQSQASRASARWTNSDAACPVCEAADLRPRGAKPSPQGCASLPPPILRAGGRPRPKGAPRGGRRVRVGRVRAAERAVRAPRALHPGQGPPRGPVRKRPSRLAIPHRDDLGQAGLRAAPGAARRGPGPRADGLAADRGWRRCL